MLKLGMKGKDSITGFVGVITGKCEYITGCSQLLLSPTVGENGESRTAHWFDEQRVEKYDDTLITLDNGNTPGCDKPAPIR